MLGVIYLVFNEGYAASSGSEWMRPELSQEALRLGRVLAELTPREPEVHGLVALMEFQASRFRARVDGRRASRSCWATRIAVAGIAAQIARGRAALARADAVGRGRGAYALQAAIAECHSMAPSTDETDWDRIVVLYEVLGRLAPSPIVDLNRAVAVAMATGPATGLRMVDGIAASGALAGSHLLPSVRGELLARLGRVDEARAELVEAARLTGNERERGVLLGKVAALGRPSTH